MCFLLCSSGYFTGTRSVKLMMSKTYITSYKFSVGCHFDMLQYIVILLTTFRWKRWNIKKHCLTSRWHPTVRHSYTLRWRHNSRDGVSNHQPHNCLLKRWFRCRSQKTSKLRVTGLCEGNSPVTGEFLAQRASNVESVSIWWRHHGADYWEYF